MADRWTWGTTYDNHRVLINLDLLRALIDYGEKGCGVLLIESDRQLSLRQTLDEVMKNSRPSLQRLYESLPDEHGSA